MAPKYKLTYFDITGLGEPIRFLLSYGGLEFEDNRIPRESWPSIKDEINPPIGQLPILEVDGQVLFQSAAIARYLGNVIGIAGATPLENWKIDAVIDTLTDFRLKIFPWFIEADQAKKTALAEGLKNETFPFFLGKFDKWVEENGGYLALNKLTWADIVTVSVLDFLDGFSHPILEQSLFSGYPNLEALKTKVLCIPSIKAWVDKRPKTAV